MPYYRPISRGGGVLRGLAAGLQAGAANFERAHRNRQAEERQERMDEIADYELRSKYALPSTSTPYVPPAGPRDGKAMARDPLMSSLMGDAQPMDDMQYEMVAGNRLPTPESRANFAQMLSDRTRAQERGDRLEDEGVRNVNALGQIMLRDELADENAVAEHGRALELAGVRSRQAATTARITQEGQDRRAAMQARGQSFPLALQVARGGKVDPLTGTMQYNLAPGENIGDLHAAYLRGEPIPPRPRDPSEATVPIEGKGAAEVNMVGEYNVGKMSMRLESFMSRTRRPREQWENDIRKSEMARTIPPDVLEAVLQDMAKRGVIPTPSL